MSTISTLTADISDVGTGDNNIIGAEYFIDTTGANGTGTALLAIDGSYDSSVESVVQVIDVNGWPDGQYTIFVHGQDMFGNWGAYNTTVLHKTSRYQVFYDQPGWQLISIPYAPVNTIMSSVLVTLDGDYDMVQYYDSTDSSDHWKSYNMNRPLNDLTDIDSTMGVWINITQPTVLTYYGDRPTTTNVDLKAGWNLVGYPSLTEKSIADALLGTGYDRPVEGDDPAAPYYVTPLTDSYMMKPGEGYWVHVPADIVWTVDW